MRPNASSRNDLSQNVKLLSTKSVVVIGVGLPLFIIGLVVFLLDIFPEMINGAFNTNAKKMRCAFELAATILGFLLLSYYCCTEGPCSRLRQRLFSNSNEPAKERASLLPQNAALPVRSEGSA